MLGVQRYPFDVAPYSATAKSRATRDAAETLGLDWMLPPLAVSFASPGQPPVPGQLLAEEHPNLHGMPRMTCRLCGECDIGCNDGAKNTLDYTYLSRAVDAGAEIRTLCEVRRIDRDAASGQYRIGYTDRNAVSPDASPDGSRPGVSPGPGGEVTVTADRLVIGAGTFGSTFLLLRNRAAFPSLGPALGTRFSGNGDLLTFLLHSRRTEADVEAATRPGPRVRPCHHQRHPHARHAGRARPGRTRLLHRGRRQPGLPRLAGPGNGRARHDRPRRPVRRSAGLGAPALSSPVQHQRQHLRVARRRSSLGRHDAGAGHGPRHPERNVPAARRGSRPELGHRGLVRLLRPGRGDHASSRRRASGPSGQHPAMAVQAGHHRPPAGRRPHGRRPRPRRR